MTIQQVKQRFEEEKKTVRNGFIGKEQIELRISNRETKKDELHQDILELLKMIKKALKISCGYIDISIYLNSLKQRNEEIQKLREEIHYYGLILDLQIYDK